METPPDLCVWCSENVATGDLIAIPESLQLDEIDLQEIKYWRLCAPCGEHFSGGQGKSGTYTYTIDGSV